jgi:CheY-like chemotaxis protein
MNVSIAPVVDHSEHPRPGVALRVLYLADDPDVAELWRLRLELDGYRVRIVSIHNPDWSVAARWTPDLMFVDMQAHRPDVSRLWRLRADPRTRPVPAVILAYCRAAELRRLGARLRPFDHVIRLAGPAALQPSGLDVNSSRIAPVTNRVPVVPKARGRVALRRRARAH